MLKGGRPFVLEFVNPKFCLSDVSIKTILNKIRQEYPEQYKNLPSFESAENEPAMTEQ